MRMPATNLQRSVRLKSANQGIQVLADSSVPPKRDPSLHSHYSHCRDTDSRHEYTINQSVTNPDMYPDQHLAHTLRMPAHR